MKKTILCILLIVATIFMVGCTDIENQNTFDKGSGQSQTASKKASGNVDNSADASATTSLGGNEPVVLKIAGASESIPAVDAIGRLFTEKYPNVTVEYEYLQNYYSSLSKRLDGANKFDLFLSTNIANENHESMLKINADIIKANTDGAAEAAQNSTSYTPIELIKAEDVFLDIKSLSGLDLSKTFAGVTDNFKFIDASSTEQKQFAIPLGCEMRGMCVNKTLLNSLNISVPTNQSELLAACATLKSKGYMPFVTNPASFGQWLMYPWVCNNVANAANPTEVYEQVNTIQTGVSELFREPCSFLYDIVKNYYYDYKKVENDGVFLSAADSASNVKNFLSIGKVNGVEQVTDNVGKIAFLPFPMSSMSEMDKAKEDFHSQIEYEFMPAPVGKNGGYVYLSPAHGIAANKKSDNIEWIVKFLNFLFTPENNEIFAEKFNCIPNTVDAFSYLASQYNVPANRISHVGQATFDYGFYQVITPNLVSISKANAPKYMKADVNGTVLYQKSATESYMVSMYDFEYYMEALETAFAKEKEKLQ